MRMSNAPLPPVPEPPSPGPQGLLREIRHVRPLPPGRLGFSLRAALAMGIPVLAGWLAGDTAAGMMATIGGFTALYCGDRPYAARAIALAAVALGFAVAVMFGLWLQPHAWAILPALALVAMFATWLCNAMRIGPAGAYLFVLACAASTAIPADHLPPWQAGLLVLGGGMGAWLLHTVGILLHPRKPERRAVLAAARAVAAAISADANGHPRARRRAAQALYDSWQMLVGFQPIPARPNGELARLRGINRELHQTFAASHDPDLPAERRAQLLRHAVQLGEEVQQEAIRRPRSLPAGTVPHGYPRSWTLLREGLAPGSNPRRQLLRIGIACLAAGLVAGALDLERAYWAVAAALLMLHQGLTWRRTLQRSLERTLGTLAGLALAGAILWLHPTGPWLVLTVMALQFTIEMVVVRNYALAVVFITSAALTIASGGQAVDDIPGMLLARGVDTVIGCACALLAFRLLPPRANARTVASEIGQCLLAIRRVCPHLERGEVTTPQARMDRRDLQHRSFLLEQALDQALDGSAEERRSASEHWPAVAACQRLVYRVLAACWDLEREAEAEAPARDSAQASAKALPQAPADDPGSMDAAVEALSSLSRAWTHGEPPPRLSHGLPPLFAGDLGDLHRFLRQKLRAS